MDKIDLLDNYLNNALSGYFITIDESDYYEIKVKILKNKAGYLPTYFMECNLLSKTYFAGNEIFRKTFNKLTDLVVFVNNLKDKTDDTKEFQSLIKLEIDKISKLIEKDKKEEKEKKRILEEINTLFK